MDLLKTILFAALCTCCAYGFTQPAVLGTDIQSGSYTTYNLNDFGIFRQYRVQATTGAGAGIRKWEFCIGTAASPDYSTNWRPYSGVCNANPDLSIPGYNQTISPDLTYPSGYASAPYNTGFGGCSGFLGLIAVNDYYTFNISEDYDGTPPSSEYMSVLQTAYNPVSITSVTQSPLAAAVYPENSVYVTITTSGSLSASEYMYLRYASSYDFASSTLLNVTMTGTTGTVEIPCTIAGDSIYYYAYTSNRTSATILAEVAALAPNGEVVHDMSTLSINNNGGPNYSYKVNPSVGFCGNYYVPSVCYPTIASFVTALNAGTVSCPVICNVAAGHTETAPAGGINLTQTGTAANTITFIKNGVGANPIIYAQTGIYTMTAGSTTVDGIFSLNGSDYITIDGIDLQESAANLTSTTQMEYGYSLFKASSSDGCQYNTIKNCSITLQASNNLTGPTDFNVGTHGIICTNVTRTAMTTLLTISTASGRNDNNTFIGNTILNTFIPIYIRGFNDNVGSNTYYDQGNTVGLSGSGNIIENYGGYTGTSYGIYLIYQNNSIISYNTINNIAAGGVVHPSLLYGIFHSSNSGSLNVSTTIEYNNVSLKNQGSNNLTGIRTGSSGHTAQNIYIANNTVENCTFNAAGTGNFYAIDQEFNADNDQISLNTLFNNSINTTGTIYLIYNNTNSTTFTINNNIISDNSKISTGSGSIYGYFNQLGTSSGTVDFSNNIIDNLSASGSSGSAVGVKLTTSLSQVKTISNNTISNIIGGSGTTIWTAGMRIGGMPAGSLISNNIISSIYSTSSAIGINCASDAVLNTSTNESFEISDNSISQVSSSGPSGTVVGLGLFGSISINCNYNILDNITTTGGTAPILRGISVGGGSGGNTLSIYNNKISNIARNNVSGTFYPTGIYIFPSSAGVNVYNNHVTDISSTGNDRIMGIYDTLGFVVHNIYNNFIERFTAPNSLQNLALNGIYVAAGGSNYNVSYNTIAFGENSVVSGGSGFGVCGMYHGAGVLALRNNIIYINANVSGNGVASCVRKAIAGTAGTAPLTSSITSSTNNNYYYINPAASNYIYVEGASTSTIKNGYAWAGATTSVANNLNNDPCFNILTAGDITSYKYFMSLSGGGTREVNSYYDIPPFAGGAILPDNLKLTTGATTYAESGAVVIAGITTDYEGDARSGTTPDIGADEGAFVVQPPDCYLLPLELISFTGWFNGAENELHWTTATEINSDYFGVQKSTNGIDFYTIGEVDAAGNSLVELNYEFFDDDPIPGINYYRLRMTDIDGEFEYSNIIAIRVDQDGTPLFVVYPNPVSSDLNFSINSNFDQTLVVEITDIPGRKLFNRIFDLHSGQNTFSIDISSLAAAPYFIYYVNDKGEKQVIQFIKE